jgi:release factor glutamine methyltransferase
VRAGVTLESTQSGGGPRLDRAAALHALAGRLRRAGIASADSEAEWLLLHALGITRTSLWGEPRALLTVREAETLASLGGRRERREPLQHLLGNVPFCGATIAVEPGVLVPRPETEGLVEAVLERLGPTPPTRGNLLDWGTGTGAIAIALLRALPGWTGAALDRSPAALSLAARNAASTGVAGRLRVAAGDFTGAAPVALAPEPASEAPRVEGEFDLLVSNPPYVRTADIPGLMPEVRDHEPREALDGGPDGLDAYRSLARGLVAWLRPGGYLALEIGADQADEVLGLFRARLIDERILPDGVGRPRILIGTMRGGGS